MTNKKDTPVIASCPSTPSQMGMEVEDLFDNDPFAQSTDPSAPSLPDDDGDIGASAASASSNNNDFRVYNAVDDEYEEWGTQEGSASLR